MNDGMASVSEGRFGENFETGKFDEAWRDECEALSVRP